MSDPIDRQAAIDAVDSETVSTNPEHFKSSEKFIKFMDDVDIASFGKWQWSNGFNTGLVATRVQLKKMPSAQPEQAIPISWIEKEIEHLESRKNCFAVMDAAHLKALIKRWEGEQDDRHGTAKKESNMRGRRC